MQLIKPDINIPFMRFTRIAAVVSVVFVVSSMVLAVVPGPNYGIDFKGGTEIQFQMSRPVNIGEVRTAVSRAGYSTKELVRVGGQDDRYRIRLDAVTTLTEEKLASVHEGLASTFPDTELEDLKMSPGGDKMTLTFDDAVEPDLIQQAAEGAGLELRALTLEGPERQETAPEDDSVEARQQRCLAAVCPFGRPEDHVYDVYLKGVADSFMAQLAEQLSDVEFTVEEIEWVGPAVGRQLRDAGIKSLLYAMGLILVYVAFRFDLRFAPGAVVCLFHDVLITIGVFVVIQREVSLPIIAALLTIVGYSLNDTIVVFDRIRENLSKIRERDLKLVVNKSINETLSRTLMTSMTTFLAILPILILARGTIQNFAIALTIGILIGTYSSVYIAAPIAVWVDEKFFKKRRMRAGRSRAKKG
jgi:preprotein translocase subunit SecF